VPVAHFFHAQLDRLGEFLLDPDQAVRVVRVDADLKPVLTKMLRGFDADPTVPHMLVGSHAAYETRDEFFFGVLDDLVAAYATDADELTAAGIAEPFRRSELTGDPEARVAIYLCSLAERLPDHAGSLVLVLDPQAVTDPAGFRSALAWLAQNLWSDWAKVLVLDDRLTPHTAGIEELSERIGVQTFHLPVEELEAKVREAVKSDASLSPQVRRQYTGMLGGFALARSDFSQAAECYRQQAELTHTQGVPTEAAQAYYCLGNVRLAADDLPAAEEEYGRALGLALDQGQTSLAGLVLTQLGVVLSRQDQPDGAAESFRLAREACRSTGMVPLLAFTLDAEAECHRRAKRWAEAERCWGEAVAVYDGITAVEFADVRQAGRTDIQQKLTALANETRRGGRLLSLGRGGV
jgi:tetratricopeptide (TPR) repeat protein